MLSMNSAHAHLAASVLMPKEAYETIHNGNDSSLSHTLIHKNTGSCVSIFWDAVPFFKKKIIKSSASAVEKRSTFVSSLH